MYHQQITEGNIIPNIDLAWSEVAYFQVGDNPGRKEPTTGEMNYRNIFRHIHAKGLHRDCRHGARQCPTRSGR
jgi:hydroxypyruvate isomerase